MSFVYSYLICQFTLGLMAAAFWADTKKPINKKESTK